MMPGSVAFQDQREFRCNYCSGKILVPKEMPPMTGPCPHCGSTITSHGTEVAVGRRLTVEVEVPAVRGHEVPGHGAPPELPKRNGGPPPLPPNGVAPATSPFKERDLTVNHPV